MPDDPQARAEAGRQRAAETKRARSHEKLIAAATTLFVKDGWYGTRVEDVAHAAGVSVATTYNHFPNKYHLLAAAYAPVLVPVLDATTADLATDAPTRDVLDRSVRRLCATAREYREMTIAVLSALPEIYWRQGPTMEPDDPRNQVEMERPVTDVLRAGERRGELVCDIPALDIGVSCSSTLCIRVLVFPDEPSDRTADVLLKIIDGGLIRSPQA